MDIITSFGMTLIWFAFCAVSQGNCRRVKSFELAHDISLDYGRQACDLVQNPKHIPPESREVVLLTG